MLSIYNYKTPEKFLLHRWQLKKEANPAFSMRAWAKNLHLSSHAMLQQMLNDKKKIPKKYVPIFIKSLELTPKEGTYLETMIDLQRAKSIEEKEVYQARLQDISPLNNVSIEEVEVYRYLKDPLHILIFEMIDLPDFKSDPLWIKKRICFETTTSEIQEKIERLIALGLLQEDAQGNLIKTRRNLTNKLDVASKGVQEYHRNISLLASKMIGTQKVEEREFNGYAINIKRSSIPEAKQLIRDFIREFATKIEAKPGQAEETYQLNMQFFALTNGGKRDEN